MWQRKKKLISGWGTDAAKRANLIHGNPATKFPAVLPNEMMIHVKIGFLKVFSQFYSPFPFFLFV